MASQAPAVSVVVTSYTMERLHDLFDLFASLEAQTFQDFEVIFVAERSQELYEAIKAYSTSGEKLRLHTLFHQGPPGLSGARNTGLAEAQGALVAFVDDDAVLFPDWLEELAKTFAEPSVVAATGLPLPLWQGKPQEWLPREFYWLISCGSPVWTDSKEVREVRNTWGHGMACRGEDLKRMGGFPTDVGGVYGKRLHGEEVDLCVRLRRVTGKRILYNPRLRLYHKVYGYRLNPRWVARSSYWTGYTKRVLERTLPPVEDEKLLDTEHQLLRRILFRLYPRMLLRLFVRPWVAARQLALATTSLFFVALGYAQASLAPIKRASAGSQASPEPAGLEKRL